MNINEFTALAAEEVLKYFPEDLQDGVKVETSKVMKINDQMLHGLTFVRGEEPAPTFYLDQSFEMYQRGATMEHLMRELAQAYEHTANAGPEPTEVPDLAFNKVKRKTGLRLLGMEYNEEFLKTVPYKDVGNGYALICEVQIKASDGGIFSTIVNNTMAKEYDYDMEQLFSAALDNAWRTNAASLMPASELDADMSDEETEGGQESCYILTTNRQRFGAAALFYPGTQAMIAHVLKEDYIAIPSSLHEFIIVRKSKAKDPQILVEFVKEANQTVVGPEDVLSDCVLIYSKDTRELMRYDAA